MNTKAMHTGATYFKQKITLAVMSLDILEQPAAGVSSRHTIDLSSTHPANIDMAMPPIGKRMFDDT